MASSRIFVPCFSLRAFVWRIATVEPLCGSRKADDSERGSSADPRRGGVRDVDAAIDVAVDDLRLARADAEHDDAEEIAEIVPAAVVGHGVDRDVGR